MSCLCHVEGLSAKAIARSGEDHPHDPSDLLRCINYWGTGRTDELQRRMAGRSIYWDRLLPHWDELVALLQHEMATRTDKNAPRTYVEMQRILNDGIACTFCDATGRGTECVKCNGTGRRSGGLCRAPRCHHGADFCAVCRGRGYSTLNLTAARNG
jgi:hypothetical protein